MYFLDGGRIYIKPKNGRASTIYQLRSCLDQLLAIVPGKQVYKVNFFACTDSGEDYRRMEDGINEVLAVRFNYPVVSGLIAQPPLTCRILAEAFYFDHTLWTKEYLQEENGTAVFFKRDDVGVLVGQTRAADNPGCRENSIAVFNTFDRLLKQAGLPVDSVVRQWNYIENITGFDSELQRYQAFNNARADFYDGHFTRNGFPAATGIGTNQGGVIVEFVAVSAENFVSSPIDNPGQVPAHEYSPEVLAGEEMQKSTPKFERARFLDIFGKKLIFISGTAAIRGEKTMGAGNPQTQTEITIQNMQQLFSGETLTCVSNEKLNPVYCHARVYLKNRSDFPAIRATFRKYYGNLPVVYLLADICREELLVEIEGKVILE